MARTIYANDTYKEQANGHTELAFVGETTTHTYTPTDGAFEFTVPNTPGIFSVRYKTASGQTVFKGEIEIKDPTIRQTSLARQMLDNINQQILDYKAGKVQSYTIAGRSFTYQNVSLDMLIKERNYWEKKLALEDGDTTKHTIFKRMSFR